MDQNKKISIYQKYAKVSKKNTATYRYFVFYALVILTLVILLLSLSFGSSHDRKSSHDASFDTDAVGDNYQSALAENMEKLASLNQQRSMPVSLSQITHLPPLHSKRYLLRQNAPTRMYQGGFSSAGKSIQQVGNRSTLSDSSPYASFVNRVSRVQAVFAKQIPYPAYTIPQGEFIHAILETAISSDLPGMLRAVITRPVYSYTKDRLLIPQGSRLVGQYSSMTSHGINRIMIVWNRIILPDGISVRVDSPGTDALGRAGKVADRVDSHFMARFGQAALLSIIAAGAANAGVNSADANNASQQYRAAMAQSFQQEAQHAVKGSQSIKPTLHVNQGALVNVFVAHDLNFYQALKKASSNDV
jgi:type IV secretion system protein VirB10